LRWKFGHRSVISETITESPLAVTRSRRVQVQDSRLQLLESFWEYREFFRSRMKAASRPASAEGALEYGLAAPVTPLNERLVQAIWNNQLLQPEGLRLADGRPVRVLDPGRWNGAGGPDFRDARVMIGGEVLSGDIELHLMASQWRAHSHDSDLDYNAVVLHVVLEIDDGKECDLLHNGTKLPRLELQPYLFPDLDTIRRSMTPDDYPYERPASLGKCYELMSSLPAEVATDFLDKAGDERLAAKVRRLEEQAATCDLEQAFYQSIMMSLGVGPTKSLYYLLAKRAPAAELIDYARELPKNEVRAGIESILLHVAGLVPGEEELAEAPEESREYAARAGEIWQRFEPYWSDRQLAPTRRWYRGIRPPNFPARRLAAVAALLARSIDQGRSLLADLRARVESAGGALAEARPARKLHPTLRELIGWFMLEGERGFWTRHYSFTAAPAANAMSLIGDSTARSIVFNAVAPALVLAARREENAVLDAAARRLYSIFPPLQSNHVTEFMLRRLFGEGGAGLVTTARRQQGLFQIFYSCCSSEEKHCESCYYLRQK
jgi:hypothetical protein